MAYGTLQNIGIKGIICALPDNKVDTTEHYDTFGKETVDKVIESTGVESTYRVLPKQTVSDLCYVAAEKLIERLGWEKESIDAILATYSAKFNKDVEATAKALLKP